jgi:hypothetical protein
MENEMNIVSDESKELANRLQHREMDLLEKVSSIIYSFKGALSQDF